MLLFVPPIPHLSEPYVNIAFITGAIDMEGSCQKTRLYPQPIIQTPINHPPSNYTIYLSLISNTVILFLFNLYTRSSHVCKSCKAVSSCSIYSLDWNCILIREMMGQVFWCGFMSARSLIPSQSNL